ncbi:type VII secretion protein EssB [Shouchella patagoniensis]|uniref:type VII secretion protein EssB n=1 Tax=Shouchella patagoniensis TaxID=228576 RepID=UPI0009954353|nr:type VII secretion protein EssB [Shouchella patagoniensis]
MEQKAFYLEQKTGAEFTKDSGSDTYKLTFQTAEVKLSDSLEIEFLKEKDKLIDRVIEEKEDELIISATPKMRMVPFSQFRRKSQFAKLTIAHSLISLVKQHQTKRLNLIVCPENLLVNDSLLVSFIYYGVKESLPPYERNEDKVFLELQTTLAVLLDGEHRFSEYMNFTDTMKLSPLAKDLMESETLDGLLEKIELWIKAEEEKDSQSYALPKKKWTIYKTSFFVILFLLVPTCVYIVYALFFLQPRYEAFISSNEAFLNTNSSQVISELEPYNPEQMPRVVNYQLAQSYVANENLNMEQAANVQNTLTLQSAEPYFYYWIAIGRGDNEEANDIAKNLQDDHLIVYANLKWREEVREDTDLSSEDRDALLSEIERVIDDYMEALEEGEQDSEEAASQPNDLSDESSEDTDGQDQDESSTDDNEEEENNDDEDDNE